MDDVNNGTIVKLLEDATNDLRLPAKLTVAFVTIEKANSEPLPPQIQACAERRRNSFAAGRRAAKAALKNAGFSGQADLAIGDDALPIWPPGWIGSISHTDDVAAAIVTPVDEHLSISLGIDIEQIVQMDVASMIAPNVAPELLPAAPDHPFNQQISQAFSAKEALYKALFPKCREFKEFSAARVSWHEDHGGTSPGMRLTLTEAWHADYPAGFSLNVNQVIAAGYVVSVVWDN